MTTMKELPIFCDNCPTLAFAVLNDAPLCEACLMEAIQNSTELRIEPLTFKEPKIYTPHRRQCLNYAAQ